MSSSGFAQKRKVKPLSLNLMLCPGLRPMTNDVLGLLLVNFCKRIVGLRMSVQQLVELRLDGLRVTVLRTLDES